MTDRFRLVGATLVMLSLWPGPAAASVPAPDPAAPTSAAPSPAAPSPAAPTSAAPGPAVATPADGGALVVTGLQPSRGAVEFFVAGRDLPMGATLGTAALTVTADGVPLPSRMRAVVRTADSGPASAVVLVADTSGSMQGDRIAAARAAAADYAAAAPPSVRLGLVTVADRATVVLPPTTDRAAFAAAARGLVARGRTALYDGVAAARDLLDPEIHPAADDFVDRRVVVLSDGADTASTIRAEELMAKLADAPATVDAVAFGAEADRARLAAICTATGGRVSGAGDAAALRAVFRTMAADLSAPVLVSVTVPPALAGRTARLRVQASFGGDSVAATETSVTFPADPRAGAAPVRFTVSGSGIRLTWVIGLVAVAIVVGCLMILQPAGTRRQVRSRLRELDSFTAGGSRTAAAAAGGGHVLRAALAVSERAVSKPDRRQRIELALDRAGLQLRAAEWQLVRAACGMGGAVLLTLLLPWWAGVPVGMFAGWLASGGYLRLRAGRRCRAFANQLPEALQLVVGSLRSGFSLAQSIDALVREGSEPVAGELGRALAETRLGGDLEDALDRVGQRNASQDMAWLVMAIRIQREVGGNLSEVLETAVETMRERARLSRHVRALSAEGRLSALILMAMPILLGGWMFAFRREYLEPLYTQAIGIAMLGGAVIMMVVGGLWLRKLVQVRV